MKILWLNAGLLLPLDKGGKLRTWHLMRHLAAKHDITYLSFSDPAETQADRDGMREVCTRLETVPRADPPKGTLRFYADAASYVFDPVPYAVAKYRSNAYRERIDRLLGEQRFDAIVCDFLPPTVNLPDRLPCPALLFTHNVEAEIWRRHAEAASSAASRALLAQQWHRMLRFERAALSRFDLVLAVSDTDRQTFQRLYPGAPRAGVHVVQTGVDTAYFRPMESGRGRGSDRSTSSGRREPLDGRHPDPGPRTPARGPRTADPGPRPPDRGPRIADPGPRTPSPATHMVFTGSMDWLPNEDAVVYFVREILPLIRRAEPAATLSIIGRSPTPAVRRLGDEPGIEVTGRVDDVRPHVAAGSVYVVPLRIGGGTRLKIFEAMAMGKAVVSTTIGAEGLPVTPRHDILIADEPQRFADAVAALMQDAATRERLGRAARALVVARHDWSAVAQDFEEALQRTCGREELVGSM